MNGLFVMYIHRKKARMPLFNRTEAAGYAAKCGYAKASRHVFRMPDPSDSFKVLSAPTLLQ
jgi:hypothetical protein